MVRDFGLGQRREDDRAHDVGGKRTRAGEKGLDAHVVEQKLSDQRAWQSRRLQKQRWDGLKSKEYVAISLHRKRIHSILK